MDGVFVRDGYLESGRVASLANNPLAERFYFHLLLVVDENGRFDADPVLLKSRCFPALDNVRATEVIRWIADCEKAELVRLHQDNTRAGKQWIEVLRHEPKKKEKEKPGVADDSESIFPFAAFWEAYGKKTEKSKCIQKYAKISEEDRAQIKEKIASYVEFTPDVQFRKNPQTWLNGRCWEDEILPGVEDEPAGSYPRYVPKH